MAIIKNPTTIAGTLTNILYGTSDPASSLGEDGDIYLKVEA